MTATGAVLLVLAATAVWLYRHHYPYPRPRTGAGASAAARGRQLRTPLVRLAELAGIRTRAGRLAQRYAAGAAGELATAAQLAPLRREGWTLLHDRALPRGRANVDHLAVSPRGTAVLVDTKHWSARWRVRVVGGRLLHGTRDVTARLDGTRHEAAAVTAALGAPVVPLVVMHGAPVDGGELQLGGIRIVPADRAAAVIRALDHTPAHRTSDDLAARAERLLPPYRR
ncbi:nuclease-related domain-containing protein [Streptomyces boncukensis]|uniref:NERD domain-containing protein n=1 Tax=Streptomyces boncukensis TaxID=2711219 RepID=A0A6G4WU65_9ACTN|nr:nuclease-related domain-containing protein [Streptomyces boncukensis]NGO68543.1 NERD domain-containing protein [Streptomyces boncukensis]